MRLAVIGGKLQGTEACYLAAKAGYETVLFDRRPAPPAAGLAREFHAGDVTADADHARRLLTTCDAVLPACEDAATLAWLDEHVPGWGVPLLFDLAAYHVSSSKLASNDLFARLGVPRPRPWPECGFPVVVKPSEASGSAGVSVVHTPGDLEAAVDALSAGGHDVVVEEFVDGPSLSLEVVALGGRVVPLQATGLEFDHLFDCKRVTAPVAGQAPLMEALDDVGQRLAEGLELAGLMDIEVMVRDGVPYVLEIDARLPSQTPTAVYHSCGINIVDLLAKSFLGGFVPPVDRTPRRACVYQHVHAARGELTVLGEHVMSGARPLSLVPGLFGADEALTDYREGASAWAATLIALAEDLATARRKADQVVWEAARTCGLRVLAERGSHAYPVGGRL